MEVSSPKLLTSKRFVAHAAYLLEMFHAALNMLGPDIELLTEIMKELGTNHIRYGVKPEMFPAMGEALIEMLEEMLGAAFTEKMCVSWVEIYDALSSDLILIQLEATKKR